MSLFALQKIQMQMHARALSLVSIFEEKTIAFFLSKEFPAVSGKLFVSDFGVVVVLDQIEDYSTYRAQCGRYDNIAHIKAQIFTL